MSDIFDSAPASPLNGQLLHVRHNRMFSSEHFSIPLSSYDTILEAQHIWELYEIYGHRFNDHWTPYNYDHPNPLERRLTVWPDIDVRPDSQSS